MNDNQSNRTRLDPRPHQVQAVDSVCNEFLHADRATAVLACGTGKTLIGAEVHGRLDETARFTIVLSPTLALLSQTVRTWVGQYPERLRQCLIVCSDGTVAPDNDNVTPDADSIPFPVTTSPVEARSVIERATRRLVVFSTYQSSGVVMNALPEGFAFDLGVFDEAHRTAGAAEREFALPLDDTNIPIRKRLFMTATPRLIHHSENIDTAVASMSDPKVYGRVVFRLPLQEAIEQGLICDYRLVVASVRPEPGVEPLWFDRKKSQLASNQASIADFAMLFALQKAIQETGARRVISYHRRVAEARAFAALCSSTPAPGADSPIPAYHVNGTMSVAVREKALAGFRSAEVALATNVRCLNEGIDIPDVDMVALTSPRSSTIDIAQICGRVLRLYPEGRKTIGYIFIPLFIAEHGPQDMDSVLDRSDFQNVVRAIHAMAAVDEDFRHSLLKHRNGVSHADQSPEVPAKIRINAPMEIQGALWNAISLQVLDRLEPSSVRHFRSWENGFAELARFVEEEAHGAVPINFVTETGFPLGRWRVIQRQAAVEGLLPEERRKMLETLGLNLRRRNIFWEKNYEMALSFYETNKHTNFPRDMKAADGSKLRGWLFRQKVCAKNERSLSLEKRKLLDQLPKPQKRTSIDLAEEFFSIHGHCRFGEDPSPRWTQLFTVASNWRSQARQGILGERNWKRLVDIGVSLPELPKGKRPRNTPKQRLGAKKRLKQLEEFIKSNGHCNVTPSNSKQYDGLYNWMQKTRKSREHGRLRPRTDHALSAICDGASATRAHEDEIV